MARNLEYSKQFLTWSRMVLPCVRTALTHCNHGCEGLPNLSKQSCHAFHGIFILLVSTARNGLALAFRTCNLARLCKSGGQTYDLQTQDITFSDKMSHCCILSVLLLPSDDWNRSGYEHFFCLDIGWHWVSTTTEDCYHWKKAVWVSACWAVSAINYQMTPYAAALADWSKLLQ